VTEKNMIHFVTKMYVNMPSSSFFSSSSSSSSVCGAGGIPPNALQPSWTYCVYPAFWVPRSPPEALHVRRREKPLSATGGIIGKKWRIKFSLTNATSTSL
jgi:hypothetical protein